MAIKSLNSVGGFSIEDNTGNVVIVIDSSGNVSASALSVAGISTLGSNANVKITGGANGQYLKTDGAGNLSWSSGGGGGTGFFLVNTRTGSVQIDVLARALTIVGRSGNISVYIS